MTYQSDPAAIPTAARGAPAAVPGWTYLDWAAIFGGALVATATSMLLLTFGSALGLSMVSVEPAEGASLRWLSIAAGIWFIWVVLSSVGVGAYLAGRLRHPTGDATSDEVELRDGTQGLVVWALAVVIGTFIAASGASAITSAAAQGAAVAGGTVVDAVQEPVAAVASTLVRDPSGATAVPQSLRDDATGILMRSLTEGELPQADQDYLIARIAAETGQTPADVEARLTEAQAAAQNLWQDAQDAIEAARRAAVITAFGIAATLLAAAATGYFAAVKGGSHRDDNIPLRSLQR
jgi:hypothetical protein